MNENDKHFIKKYEELLDKGYCDCNEMNCIDNNSPRRILNIVNNLQSKIDKAIDKLESLLPMYIMPNNMLIHATEKAKTIEETLDILKEDK